jgi:gluconolactonase
MTSAAVRTLAVGAGFTEGPMLTAAGEIVHVSIDQGVLWQLAADGRPHVFADLPGGPNGACPGPGGEVYVAQNGGNWMVGGGKGTKTESGVQAVRPDGTVRWISTAPLAPNDLCFGPDRALYVTDPSRRRTYDDGRIWRYDPDRDAATVLFTVGWFPNGIAFGPEEDVVYVASTGDGRIIRLPVNGASGARTDEVFAQLDHGYPDGMAFDAEGNLLVGANSHTPGVSGDIQVFGRDGKLTEILHVGPNARYTNLAISGDATIVFTDSDGGAIRAVDGWHSPGLALYPRRHDCALEPRLAPGLAAPGSASETHTMTGRPGQAPAAEDGNGPRSA